MAPAQPVCPICGDTPEWCPEALGTLKVARRKAK